MPTVGRQCGVGLHVPDVLKALTLAAITVALIAPIFGSNLKPVSPSPRNLAGAFAAATSYTGAITFNPPAIYPGTQTVGTLTRTPAPVSALTYTLSIPLGHPNKFPRAVSLGAGKTSTTFAFKNINEPFAGDVNLPMTAASYDGDLATGSIRILKPRNVTNIDFDADTATQGEDLVVYVTFDRPTPAEGMVLAVSTTSPDLVIPTRISVPGGKSLVTITAHVKAGASPQDVDITVGNAFVGGGTPLTETISVEDPWFEDAWFSPSIVLAGTSTNGRILLSGRAPKGGIQFKLGPGTGSPVATPTTVTFPEGSRYATYAVSALAPAGNKNCWATVKLTGLGASYTALFWDEVKVFSPLPNSGVGINGLATLRPALAVGKVSYSFPIPGNVPFPPVMAAGDILLINGYAIDAKTGKQLWSQGYGYFSPAVGVDGLITGAGGIDPVSHKIELTNYFPLSGSPRWTSNAFLAPNGFGPTFTAANGTIYGYIDGYPISGGGTYYKSFAVNLDGSKCADGSDIINFFPQAQGADGTLYGYTGAPQYGETIDAYGPHNVHLWSKPVVHISGPPLPVNPPIVQRPASNVIYVADALGITAYDNKGAKVWQSLDASQYQQPSLALGHDGIIYRSTWGIVDAHTSAGALLWEGLYTGPMAVAAHMGADHVIHDDLYLAYLSSDSNGYFSTIGCFDGKTKAIHWSLVLRGTCTQIIVGSTGTVYCYVYANNGQVFDGKVYALK